MCQILVMDSGQRQSFSLSNKGKANKIESNSRSSITIDTRQWHLGDVWPHIAHDEVCVPREPRLVPTAHPLKWRTRSTLLATLWEEGRDADRDFDTWKVTSILF